MMIVSVLFFLSCAEKVPEAKDDESPDVRPEIQLNDGIELSYWIDMDLLGNHRRGYWLNLEAGPERLPEEGWIDNACSKLHEVYGASKLYVIYHRQFEIEQAKSVFMMWKKAGGKYGLDIVPSVVVKSYCVGDERMNFTDSEMLALARWCVLNVNEEEFGIYDVYPRDTPGSDQIRQLEQVYDAVGNKIVRVCIQPDTPMDRIYKYGVQDTWTAECQGRTNELWKDPVCYRGVKRYGRVLLEDWVMQRVNGESRKIVWDLIPVAWDYDKNDPLSYDCPGDDARYNDAPIPGRLKLCHKYIAGCYPGGVQDHLFGGYSCDLHILQANSSGKHENPNFYQSLRLGKEYKGVFSGTMLEIGGIYKSLRK